MIIVSGLAKGIDTVAHETALEFGLKTISVLAGGLQHIYPPENKNLAEEILKNGALVSEFPLGVKPLARNFPLSPDGETGFKKINPDDLGEKQSRILKALNDGVEEIDAIYEQTGLEMNFLLATLLELELTGTVENIGGQIYRLRVELEIPSN